jgi:uncharacterized protein YjbI with pentapeptide repeats
LPADWQLTSGYLIGPRANLGGANLTDLDLGNAVLTGVVSGGIIGTPSQLPADWQLTNEHLVGPGADLSDANLAGAQLAFATLTDTILEGATLADATLTGVVSGGIIGTPSHLPVDWEFTMGYLVGPGANLTDAILPNVQLAYANLSGANLSGANLSNGDLHNAQLASLTLTDANLSNTNLKGATLVGVVSGGIVGTPSELPAQWQVISGYLVGPGANLVDANMTDAQLTLVNLRDANLTNVTMTSADLTGTDLQGATLAEVVSGGIIGVPSALPVDWQLISGYLVGPRADLTNAVLTNMNLADANLTDTNLAGAELWGADLTDANLAGADLTGAQLAFATLNGAKLASANLSDTTMLNAHLDAADLYGVNLTDARYLTTTDGNPFYYANTTLPTGFNPASKGWILAPDCDFTPDAACDLADIQRMFEAGDLVTGVATSAATDRLDLTDDGAIDAADITEWLSLAATSNGHSSSYFRGDTELDRDIDLSDYNTLTANFDPSATYGPYGWEQGNFDGDHDVDLADYNSLASNFRPLGYGTETVPEPSGLVLAVAGLLAAVVARPGARRTR